MANQYDITADQIAQHQALLNALSAQSLQSSPGVMAGNVYVGSGLLQALAKPLEAIAANYGQKNLDQQSLANNQAAQAAKISEIQGLMGGGSPQPQAQTPTTPITQNPAGTSSFAAGSTTPIDTTGGTSGPQSPLVNALAQQSMPQQTQQTQQSQGPATGPILGSPGNPLAALTQGALSSQFPDIESLGQKLLLSKATQKPETFTPQTVIGPDGNPIQILQGNYGTQKISGYNPAVENKVSTGGQVYNPLTVQVGDKLAIRPPTQISATANMPPQEKAFDVEMGNTDAKNVQAARQDSLAAQKTFLLANRLQALDQNGIFSGPTAKPALFVNQLATGLGLPLSPDLAAKVANTENWTQNITEEISHMILASNGVGRGFTDTDRDFVEKKFPGLMQSPAGRAQAIQFLQDAALRGVDQARQTEAAIRNGQAGNLDITGGAMDAYRQSKQQPQTIPGYDALPSGATYTAPDGTTRRKQ